VTNYETIASTQKPELTTFYQYTSVCLVLFIILSSSSGPKNLFCVLEDKLLAAEDELIPGVGQTTNRLIYKMKINIYKFKIRNCLNYIHLPLLRFLWTACLLTVVLSRLSSETQLPQITICQSSIIASTEALRYL